MSKNFKCEKLINKMRKIFKCFPEFWSDLSWFRFNKLENSYRHFLSVDSFKKMIDLELGNLCRNTQNYPKWAAIDEANFVILWNHCSLSSLFPTGTNEWLKLTKLVQMKLILINLEHFAQIKFSNFNIYFRFWVYLIVFRRKIW